MRTLSEAEQKRFNVCTKNAIDRLLYDPIKYLNLTGSLSREEIAVQVRIEIVNLTNIASALNIDFWEFAKTCEHSAKYDNLRQLFEEGRCMNSLEYIFDSEFAGAA